MDWIIGDVLRAFVFEKVFYCNYLERGELMMQKIFTTLSSSSFVLFCDYVIRLESVAGLAVASHR